jgi:fido (protein-threonine AMPylation protein)
VADDPYIDPRTGILRNKPGLATQKELDGFEAEQTWLRLSELAANPIPGNFDAAHYQAIHRFIFQDVYDWAGELRTVNAPKIEGSRAMSVLERSGLRLAQTGKAGLDIEEGPLTLLDSW